MKKSLIIALLITSFMACKKDSAENNSDRITGRWIVEKVAEINYENGVEKNRIQNSTQSEDQICDFRKDGTATVNLDGGDVEVKWTATNSKLVLTVENGERVEFNIITVTKNSLTIEFEEDLEVQNGITYRSTIEFTMRK